MCMREKNELSLICLRFVIRSSLEALEIVWYFESAEGLQQPLMCGDHRMLIKLNGGLIKEDDKIRVDSCEGEKMIGCREK